VLAAAQSGHNHCALVEAEIAATTKLMEKANQVSEQPFGELRPDAAAKMFLAAHNIGSAVLGFAAANGAIGRESRHVSRRPIRSSCGHIFRFLPPTPGAPAKRAIL